LLPGMGHGVFPVQQLADAEADLLAVAGLDDGGAGPREQLRLQRRVPLTEPALDRVAEELGELAAHPRDVLDHEAVLTKPRPPHAQPEDRIGQEAAAVFQTGDELAVEQHLDAQPGAGAAAIQPNAGLPVLLLVMELEVEREEHVEREPAGLGLLEMADV